MTKASEFNEGHIIEGLDRCHTIMILMDEIIIEHPAVIKAGVNDDLLEAQGLIMKAYQAIGALSND